jgi:TRAP transporter TAXI family solute receptor
MRLHVIIAILASVFAGCRPAVQENPDVPVVRMVTVLGRVMDPLAEALRKVLPDRFPARIEVIRNVGTDDYASLIEDGKAEISMLQSDFAYLAYNTGIGDPPRQHRRLRGVALLYASPVHFIATESSGIRSLLDLRGKRVSVGPRLARSEYTAKRTLEGVGLTFEDFIAKRMTDAEAAKALREGKLDAVLARGNDPSPNVQEMLNVPGTKLIPISRAEIEKIRSTHPFLHAVTVPAGVYGNHPNIETVGVDSLLVCREDLAEELVYWITRTMFESLPELAKSLNSLRQVDLEQIQASPIPLHPGAARFYRERELFQ